MDKETWKRELFPLYSRDPHENEWGLIKQVRSSVRPPKQGSSLVTAEPLHESVLLQQTQRNTYGSSK